MEKVKSEAAKSATPSEGSGGSRGSRCDGLPVSGEQTVEEVLLERALFELDVHYPWLAPFTMPTVFVPVSLQEVQVWRRFNRGAPLAAQETKVTARLRDALDCAIQTFRPSPQQLQASHSSDLT